MQFKICNAIHSLVAKFLWHFADAWSKIKICRMRRFAILLNRTATLAHQRRQSRTTVQGQGETESMCGVSACGGEGRVAEREGKKHIVTRWAMRDVRGNESPWHLLRHPHRQAPFPPSAVTTCTPCAECLYDDIKACDGRVPPALAAVPLLPAGPVV